MYKRQATDRVNHDFFPTYSLHQDVVNVRDMMNRYHLDHSLTYLGNAKEELEEESLLVDPGAHDNLCGSEFVNRMQRILDKYGLTTTEQRLTKAALVGGVGHGVQTCLVEHVIPIRMRGGFSSCYRAPMVPNSSLPALLGNKSLMRNRALFDIRSGRLWFCGPGDVVIRVPPGTAGFQCKLAKSGHWMLPISHFNQSSSSNAVSHEFHTHVLSDSHFALSDMD